MQIWKTKRQCRQSSPGIASATGRFFNKYPAIGSSLPRCAWAAAILHKFANLRRRSPGADLIFQWIPRMPARLIRILAPNIHLTLSSSRLFLSRTGTPSSERMIEDRTAFATRPVSASADQGRDAYRRPAHNELLAQPKMKHAALRTASIALIRAHRPEPLAISIAPRVNRMQPALNRDAVVSIWAPDSGASRVARPLTYRAIETWDRIVSRTRRVEDQMFLVRTNSATQPYPRLSQAVVGYPGVKERRTTAADYDLTSAAARAEPAINVTQLTDEVLKQLDRRMISARERLGRI
jgi:hypothetical protein